MEFFTNSELSNVQRVQGSPYDSRSVEYSDYQNIRKKLEYFVFYVAEKLNVQFEIVRRDKFNRQAGYAANHNNWADYILVGACLQGQNLGKMLFIKFCIANLSETPYFLIELDIDYNSKDYKAPDSLKQFIKNRDNPRSDYLEVSLDELEEQNWDCLFDNCIESIKRNIDFYKDAYKFYKKETSINEKSKTLMIELFEKSSPNIILYGPPGTGKTYKIQNEYCQLFTDKQYKQTAEEKLRDDIKSFPWWKVVAAVLYKQAQPIDVKTIASDILVEAKYRKVKTPATNIIWNELLTSGDDESSKLAMKYRAKTQLFKKDDNSRWSLIDKTVIETIFPDIVELSKSNYSVPETMVNNKRYKFVTFHQKYGYEDFIEGIRPVLSKETNDENSTEKSSLSFELRKGIFYQCCLKALELAGFDSFEDCHNCSKEERKQRFEAIKNIKEKQYAIFIDEINRANISAVFGELITLIEEDKRIGADNELWLELPGSNSFFAVPSNLYIIGTMNTADKSIALVDIALRRRFEFLKMYPDYDLIPEWSDLLKKLNESIYSIKRNADFFIGHSFFIDKPNTELPNIFNRKIIPLLLEYFQNNTESVKKVLSAANIMVTEDDNHQIIA